MRVRSTTRSIDLSAPYARFRRMAGRSEEHTSELQSQSNLVCRLLLEKKKTSVPSTTPSSAPTSADSPVTVVFSAACVIKETIDRRSLLLVSHSSHDGACYWPSAALA